MGKDGGRDPGHSLRGLTAPGSSKVGVDKAMRARDVSRPHGAAPADQARGQGAGVPGSTGRSPDSS
jgi:hypothetical protein